MIDFDNTLFDTDSLKKAISGNFKKKFGSKNLSLFWKVYSESTKTLKYADIKIICKNIYQTIEIGSPEQFEDLFLKSDFKKYVFKHSKQLINAAKKRGKVIIYSLGDSYYQPVKIKGSGIESLVGKNNIKILKDKKGSFGSTIFDLKLHGFNQIMVVDDRPDFLEDAKKIDPACIAVRFKFGKYRDISPADKFPVNYETDDPEDLVRYIDNFIAAIPQKGVNDNISVLKDLSKSQIKELIRLTNKDYSVKKFTHDRERFSSLKSFNSWKARGKNIYAMVGRHGKLLGIAWFSGRKAPSSIAQLAKKHNCNHTFAIRNYPPARHKGLSPKFIHIVFKDYGVSKDNGVWLSSSKNNVDANNLYTNYGFKKVAETEQKQVIYLSNG